MHPNIAVSASRPAACILPSASGHKSSMIPSVWYQKSCSLPHRSALDLSVHNIPYQQKDVLFALAHLHVTNDTIILYKPGVAALQDGRF